MDKPQIYDDERWELFEQIASPKEVGQIFDYHPQTVRDWCNEGKVIASKFGWEWVIIISSVKEFLERSRDKVP